LILTITGSPLSVPAPIVQVMLRASSTGDALFLWRGQRPNLRQTGEVRAPKVAVQFALPPWCWTPTAVRCVQRLDTDRPKDRPIDRPKRLVFST
jgi:hypothetical protein